MMSLARALDFTRLRDALAPAPQPERPALRGPHDWLFVTAEETRGWILDAICREIGSRQRGTWTVAYGAKIDLPPARVYFFSHYLLYLIHRRRNPHITQGRVLVWYTHPRDSKFSIEEQIEAYNQTTQMVCTCSQFRQALIDQGLDPARATVVLGAADPERFRPHRRGGGAIGLSSAFYERKSPDTLLELVKLLPHRRFVLLGRGWEAYARWDELSGTPNFTYLTAPYSEYPKHNSNFDVFLSLATLEGGPIPLMEAMMCNVAPVASRTGFAPDIIRHGENGFLFDVGSPAGHIAPLVDAAFGLKTDVRRTVRRYTWQAFARRIHALVESG
jgi:glycosyltransferase involved in cell wall biosynthesis